KYLSNSRNIQVNYLFSLKKEILETQNNNTKNKKVIYTCITGRYNNLFVHTYINRDYDYVCFTDDPILIEAKVYGNWIIKPVNNIDSDNSKINRYYKMHPHEIFQDYDYSLYVDANVDIKTSYIFECVEKCIEENIYLSIPKHYQRDCIYDEALEIIESKIDNIDIVNKQIELYKKEGFPQHYGLA
ncbi:glycosyltransferase domain-containing protein, partial [Brachyspira hyodysenteriae]|uniref:glycosyltransferase domain-containing protein n=1 Tax=Brachyspira hyodysenteriae TaxID=159 RepID=UPI000AA3B588